MVQEEPTVIVSCTNRKSVSVEDNLRVRNLDLALPIDEAVHSWALQVESSMRSKETIQIRNLYQGEYWSVASSLECHADMKVVSAGLGLKNLGDYGVGYGATFSPHSEDSVGNFQNPTQADSRVGWWEGLRRHGIGVQSWKRQIHENVIVVVSEPYQRAIWRDLCSLAEDGHLVKVVSGSPQIGCLKEVKGLLHVEVGQWLRMVLGGSTPNVSIRFVAELLKEQAWPSVEGTLDLLAALRSVYEDAASAKLPFLQRIQLCDDEIADWIQKALSKEGEGLTKSTALRRLRAEGFACEQTRFGTLFHRVVNVGDRSK